MEDSRPPTEEMSEEQMEKMKELEVDEEMAAKIFAKFCFVDVDKSGYIDVNEIMNLLQILNQNPSREEAEAIIEKADINNDRKIDFIEFVKVSKEHMKTEEDLLEALKDAFKKFDKNGDGYLDRDEMRDVLTTKGEPLTESEVNNMFDLVDVDNDGRVNFEEFVTKFSEQEEVPDPED